MIAVMQRTFHCSLHV